MYTKQNDQVIKVNISLPVRIYQKGQSIYDEKEYVLNKMKQRYNIVYLDDYEQRKKILILKIGEMEGSPFLFQDILGRFTYDTQYYYLLKKINVHEDIPPLSYNFKGAFESMFSYYEQEINRGRELLYKLKFSIECLFDKDEEIANKIIN